ncbi:MAG: multidrug effflux MFS transporter, partial [Pseudomonadota bacterium]
RAGRPAMPQSKRFILTLGMLTAVAALTVDLSLPAVPAMAAALLSDISTTQKIIGVFMAGMACGQIPAGLLSDRLGRLPVLYAGMLVFTLSGAVVAVADNIELILAARFVQGFGAASSIVLSRAIVRDIASGVEAAKLMSLMTMIFTAAPVIAPTAGALLIEFFDWRAPFLFITAAGILLMVSIRRNLHETHTPTPGGHPVAQLLASFREFFSHRQSVFGLLLIIAAPAGFMSIITISSALITETYGYSLTAYGLIFALAGGSILVGSLLNRLLVTRFRVMQLVALGIALQVATGAQFILMVVSDSASLPWLWTNVCVFMASVGILLPNATVLALDPLRRIAGVASSIIGTLNNVSGAAGAILGAAIYDGSVRSSMLIIAVVTVVVTAVFLAKPMICPTGCEPGENVLARD